MGERVDLAEVLADYGAEGPRPAAAAAAGEPGDTVYLGEFVRNLRITGPPGPPPSWVITEPPHANQWDMNAILTGVGGPAGQPPPKLQFDGSGMYYRNEHGERVDVSVPDRCAQCLRYLPAVTIRAGEPVLCAECRHNRETSR